MKARRESTGLGFDLALRSSMPAHKGRCLTLTLSLNVSELSGTNKERDAQRS